MDTEKVDVLAIGAHAGDVEISMGMLLAHYVNQGKRAAICHLTPGEKGHPTLSPSDYADLKRREAVEAAEVVNAPLYQLPYMDGELPVNDEVKFALADVIRDCRPDIVVTHWEKSIHKDHINCHLNIPDAVFYAAIKGFDREKPPHFARSLYFAENWEDSEGFVPEIYVELQEGDIDLWQQMVDKYALFRCEVVEFPYVEYYRSLARVRGIEMYCQYASALAVPSGSRKKRVQML